jgi:hypothetical protein
MATTLPRVGLAVGNRLVEVATALRALIVVLAAVTLD